MAAPTFSDALLAEVSILQAEFPHLADALSRAHAIITESRMFLEDNGHEAMVASSDGTTHYFVNGACSCPAAYHRTHEPCKHRYALRLYQRATDRLAAQHERWTLNLDTEVVETPATAEAPTIRPEWLVTIQGRGYIRFEGLLELAHQRGLVSLETVIVQATEVMAIAQCTAVFSDGCRFTDIGDATERNVARHLAPHFVRMAGTRASARCLRRALNISACSVEELGEDLGA